MQTRTTERVNRMLLVSILVLLVLGALKLTASVAVPLAFSLFLIAVLWPLYDALEARTMPSVALLGTLLSFLLVVAAFVAGLWYTVAFFLIGILEIRLFRDKLETAFGRERSARWLDSFRSITRQFQRFFLGRTVVGLLTGLMVGVASVLVGLDLAFLWGFTNLLLNYIPIIGSIVAVIPPALFALVQYQDPQMALIALLTVGGVQTVMRSFVDPQIQGRFVAISPLAGLISVALLGWVWGIGGMFLAVPILTAVALTAVHFERTRWIGTLLTRILRHRPES